MARRREAGGGGLEVRGSLWINAGQQSLGGHGRMALLRAVDEQGSITRAAKVFGMSYKAAWEAIDTMNRVAGEPLVERATGGRGGGSTRLTEHGRRLLQRYGQLDAAHQRFVALLSGEAFDLAADFSILKVLNMKTTARNQFHATVSALRAGAVNDEVELTLAGGARLVAIVTRESTEELGLRIQQPALVLIQAAHVLLASELGEARVSARNRLDGRVAAVRPGAVNAEVTLELDQGGQLNAIVTEASVKSLGLVPGARATALIKASDLILAVAA
ncbi:TOBE domain-containing protein [Pelomonas sp. CA6]|uniref:TOBE domain-containing protein n=1 Tax=Pelomonas sp. CA6 TaxID=2907999 RepID=UPI001F4C060A|nr:TOBE domain-containing protein [Pelomonas sp. CA6]MCH7344271.1 TOBE domain-containing protein [Pelomonas sp. CA6]